MSGWHRCIRKIWKGWFKPSSTAVDSGSGYQCEYRTLTASGEIRWLAGRGQVLLGTEGYDSRAVGTVTDITERKQLEERLRYATESLNIAQTAAGVATFDFNFRRNSRICSDNFHELLGMPDTTPLDDLNLSLSRVHPDDVARMRSAPLRNHATTILPTAANTGCCSRAAASAGSARRPRSRTARPARWCASPAPSSTSAT